MSITNSLIQGLTQPMVQARLNTADARPFHFGRLFPIKRVNGSKWQMMTNQLGSINVAADIHTDNGTIQRKRRPKFESAMGDIPFIAISREMTREELKEYHTALALSPDSDATKLVQYWGNDVDFCFNGVQSELEYIALALLSNAGKLDFTTGNNATFANEFSLDYYVDEAMKISSASDWGNQSNADIIGDLAKAVELGKKKGLNPKFAFVNLQEFYRICSAEQIIKQCASFASNALKISQTPDLKAVNEMLAKQAWLNGLQLRVIDQTVTREMHDGNMTSGNPFADKRMVLTESEVLGSTQYSILPENNPSVIRAERGHTVIRKFGQAEPQAEITMGQADAMPVLDTAYRNIYIKTDGIAW